MQMDGRFPLSNVDTKKLYVMYIYQLASSTVWEKFTIKYKKNIFISGAIQRIILVSHINYCLFNFIFKNRIK